MRVGPWLVLAAIVLLGGCTRAIVEEAPAEINFSCSRCLSSTQPVGYAPLFMAFVFPYDADWSFGDGATASGTFVSHTFTDEGLYLVQAVAEMVEGRGLRAKTVKVVGRLWVRVFTPRDNSNETALLVRFAEVIFVSPKQLRVGQHAQVCFYATTRAYLDVFSVELYESDELLGESGEFEFMRIRVPAGVTLENCVMVRGFRTGDGFIDARVFAASGADGERRDARIFVEVTR